MSGIARWSVVGSMVIIAGSVALLGVALLRQGRMLERIESRLQEASAARVPTMVAALGTDAHGLVIVSGEVLRPGIYEIPANGVLTALRLIAFSGAKQEPVRVYVLPVRNASQRLEEWKSMGQEVLVRDGAPCMVFTRQEPQDPTTPDLALRADDKVWVAMQ